jgi:hypothetical protein
MHLQSIFWVIPVLDNLLKIEKFDELYRVENEKIVRGYAFVEASTIAWLIDTIINAPQLLGFEEDWILYRASYTGLPFYRLPYHSAAGMFARNLAELYRPLLGVNTWDELRESMSKIEEKSLIPLKKIFDLKIDSNKALVKKKTKEMLLNEIAMFYNYIYHHDLNKIRIAYNNTYLKGKTFFAQATKVPITLDGQEFFNGYKLALKYLWQCFLGNGFTNFSFLDKIPAKRNWKEFDTLFEKIRDEIIVPMENSSGIDYLSSKIFLPRGKIPTSFFGSTINTPNFSPSEKSIEETLDETLLWYPIKIVNVPSEAPGFVSLLLGFSKLKEEQVEVVEFIHPEGPGKNSYSFALLVESSGIITDYSYWLLFHRFATDFSGAGGYALKFVRKHLSSLGGKVNLRKLSVNEGVLYEYARDASIRMLEKELMSLKYANDELRGQLLELYVIHLIDKMEYYTYWRYRNPFFLKDKEIDILAIKKNEKKALVLVIETIGTFPAKTSKLKKELKEKITSIQNHWEDILEDLKIKGIGPEPEIQGWIVTSDSVKKKKMTSEIFIKDIEDLERLSKCYKIRYKEFLIPKYLKSEKGPP